MARYKGSMHGKELRKELSRQMEQTGRIRALSDDPV